MPVGVQPDGLKIMPTYKTKGIVLFKKDLSQDDGLFVILSQNFGKITVKARGVRKIQSKLASHLLSFNLVDLTFASGRFFDQITSVNVVKTHPQAKNNLKSLSLVFFAAEAIDQLVKEKVPEPELFSLFKNFLDLLNEKKITEPLSYFLSLFIFKLIYQLGYQPELYLCQNCRQKILPEKNYFSPELKGVICLSCQNRVEGAFPISNNTIKILRLASKLPLEKLMKIKVGDREVSELDRLAQILLKSHLDQELKSENFLRLIFQAKSE
jgi:DNA repair protein RecO (recombination protein O)